MKLDAYHAKIIAAIGLVLETDDLGELHPQTRLEKDLGFTSGILIELMMYLEEMIDGLTLFSATLDYRHFETIDTLARFIRAQETGT